MANHGRTSVPGGQSRDRRWVWPLGAAGVVPLACSGGWTSGWRASVVGLLALVGLSACGGSVAPAAPGASSAPPASSKAAASVLASPAAASSVSAKPATSGAAQASARLDVAYGNISGDAIPLWVGIDDGIFKSLGLDVHADLVKGGTESMAAIVGGKVQFGEQGGAEALGATAGGADISVIMVGTPVYPYKLYVPADIKTPADLKGKKIDITNVGSSVDVATRVGLKKLGLTPNDVVFMTMGTHSTGTAALLSGAIQGRMDNMPGAQELEAQGYHSLLDLASQKLPAANTAVTGQTAWIAAHKDLTQKFIDGMIVATARAKADKRGTLAIMKKHFKLDDDVALQKTYDFYTGEVYADLPYPKPEQFTDAKDALVQKNPKVASVDVNKLLDPSFVKSAADRGIDKKK